jgi:chromosome segregation ATPase
MGGVVIVVVGVVQAVLIGTVLFFFARRTNRSSAAVFEVVQDEVAQKQRLAETLGALTRELADPDEVRSAAKSFLLVREALKVERGRAMITQAELETIEFRIRELDEVARELEASMTETREELAILQRKEEDLAGRNQHLKQQISESMAKMDALGGGLTLSSQMQEQIARMKSEVMRAEGQIQILMEQIQAGNEQYFTFKKRYDALDIEFAQLYERFTEQQRQGARGVVKG